MFFIVRHYEIFHLPGESAVDWVDETRVKVPRLPTAVHPSLFLLRFAIWRAVAAAHVTGHSLLSDMSQRAYFYSPGTDMAGNLLGLWPLQRSSNGPCIRLAKSTAVRWCIGLTAAPFPVDLVQRRFSYGPEWATRGIRVDVSVAAMPKRGV